MDELARSLGVPAEVLRYAICLGSGYPLAILFNFIRNEQLKHLFSITTSTFLFLYVFSLEGWLHVLCSSLYTWLITKYYGKKDWCPPLVFVLLMSQMSYVHMIHQVWYPDDPSHVDSSSTMMVLIMKLSLFAWSVKDAKHSTNPEHKKNAVPVHPPLLDFLGYSFFFLGVWVGPAFPYATYRDFIKQTGEFEHKNISYLQSLKCAIAGLTSFGLMTFFGSEYHFVHCAGPKFKNEFNFIQKLVYIQVAALIVRAKYYGVWKIAESTACLTNIAYKDGKYDRAENVHIVGIELGQNAKSMTDSWNKYTNMWLKNTVYTRVTLGATSATYFASAFWHGFYPGYYLTFMSAVFITMAGRAIRRNLRPLFIAPGQFASYKTVYDYVGIFFTLTTMNYFFIPFMTRQFYSSFEIWRDTYFVGHVGAILTILILDKTNFGKILKKRFVPIKKE
ncbi:MBOAT, membrane-bound O-acyltransferase family-domain-containing protein [Gorgonomyces haynaldii]|nr:MBOAT, membrane-bound O-acyltransferase family-domain-containing protein [Gorgonomyces haynaldii]